MVISAHPFSSQMCAYLKKKGKDTRKNEVIQNILEDDSCFIKMNKEDAKMILKDIGVAEDRLELIYSELTNK